MKKKNFRHSETSRNDFSSVEGENVAGEKNKSSL